MIINQLLKHVAYTEYSSKFFVAGAWPISDAPCGGESAALFCECDRTSVRQNLLHGESDRVRKCPSCNA